MDVSGVKFRFGRGAQLSFTNPRAQEETLVKILDTVLPMRSMPESLRSFGQGHKFYNPNFMPNKNGISFLEQLPKKGLDYVVSEYEHR